MFIPPPNPQVGQAAGSIAGGLAGAALLAPFDGPLPILDTIGGIAGGAIGGKIGETTGSYMPKMRRMAGQIFKMEIADPNRHQVPSILQDYVKY